MNGVKKCPGRGRPGMRSFVAAKILAHFPFRETFSTHTMINYMSFCLSPVFFNAATRTFNNTWGIRIIAFSTHILFLSMLREPNVSFQSSELPAQPTGFTIPGTV